MKTKNCSCCKQEKAIDHFNRYKSRLQSWCKSCQGKYRKEWLKKHPRATWERAQRWMAKHPKTYWARAVIANHKKEKQQVLFTSKQLVDFVNDTETCRICGVVLNWTRNGKNGKKKFNSPSLDRIDNSSVLRLTNIQVLCSRCNSSKQDRTMEEFVDYCSLVSKKFSGQEQGADGVF